MSAHKHAKNTVSESHKNKLLGQAFWITCWLKIIPKTYEVIKETFLCKKVTKAGRKESCAYLSNQSKRNKISCQNIAYIASTKSWCGFRRRMWGIRSSLWNEENTQSQFGDEENKLFSIWTFKGKRHQSNWKEEEFKYIISQLTDSFRQQYK